MVRELRSRWSEAERRLTEERGLRETLRIEAAGFAERHLVRTQRVDQLQAEVTRIEVRIAEASRVAAESRATFEREEATLSRQAVPDQHLDPAGAEAAVQQARHLLRKAEQEAEEQRRHVEDLERRILRREADDDAARVALQTWEARRAEIATRLEDLETVGRTIEQEVTAARRDLEATAGEISDARSLLSKRRASRQQAEEALTAARRDADRLTGEQAAVIRMQGQVEAQHQGGEGTLLVDVVPVAARYEAAVAAALGSAARFGVVDADGTAWDLDRGPGPETILVPRRGLSSIPTIESFWGDVASILADTELPPYVPACDVLSEEASRDLAARYLATTLIVDTLDAAKALARRLLQSGRRLPFQVASLDGHCLRGNGEHVLAPEPAVQQEIELRARRTELVAQVEAAKEQLAGAETASRAAQIDEEQSAARVRAAEDARRVIASRLARSDEQRRLNLAAQQRERGEVARLDQTRPRPALRPELGADVPDVDAARAAYETARELVRSRGEALDEVDQQLRSVLQRAANLSAQQAARAERMERLRQTMTRDEREAQTLVTQAIAIRDELAGLDQELRDLVQRRASGDGELQAADARVAEIERLIRDLESQVVRAEGAVIVADEGLEQHQVELDRLREQEADLAAGAERARGTLARLEVEADSAAEHLGLAIEELERFDGAASDIGGLDDESLQRRLSRAMRDLRNVGNVDYGVLAEHRAMEDRYTYLTEQLDDLTATEAKIREGMEEARAQLQEQFSRAFEEVNAHFKELFRDLFRGGDAELLLSGEADRPQSGVDIVAQPPGKRLHRLATLSGGERALVGAALLLALISANPSPFCMLDEVDAALDEANVQRFVATVRQMATRTQFILVTHNRATMEMADALFGVTMNPGAISQVLAIRLPDERGN
jgi:chromosome segregation protein